MEKGKGLFFVFSAPSGTGKTSIIKGVCEKDKSLVFSVSVTTRPQRPAEQEGIDYIFISNQEFEEKIKNNSFIEYARVFDHYYGTLRDDANNLEEKKQDLILDMDWQGADQVRSRYNSRVVSIFILPPSLSELEARLKKRGQDSPEVIDKRLKKAVQEIQHWREYTYVIINECLEQSIAQALSIIQSERLSALHNLSLPTFVSQLLNP